MNHCLICREPLQEIFCFMTCNCTGAYHPNCINNWLIINKKCPTCNKHFKDRCNSNSKLLKRALFRDSIGRFETFRRQQLIL